MPEQTPKPVTKPLLTGDLSLIESTVRQAGDIARSYFRGVNKQWDKGKGHLVSDADLAVNIFLRDRLMTARPHYGWLSEESEDDRQRLAAEITFVVDPIDGTVAFLKGKPHFTICVATVRDGVPLTGAVYNPVLEEFYTAEHGLGARLNGRPIHVRPQNAVAQCRMLGDRKVFADARWMAPPLEPWPEMHVETRNSMAYRLALIADGRFDAAISLWAKRDWDLAAADLILREAGGNLTTRQGVALRYNGVDTIQHSVVAAGPDLHPQLLKRLKALDTDA